jgi:hypothetical protein
MGVTLLSRIMKSLPLILIPKLDFLFTLSFYKLHSVFKNKLLIMFVDKSLNHQGGDLLLTIYLL